MKNHLNKLDDIEFAKLVLFIRNQIGEDRMPILRETLIEDDLGVTGDEGEDLIRAFAAHYDVDISDFMFSNYFFEEPSNFFFSIGDRKIKPFTVRHLEKAIIARRLDENVIKDTD